MRRLKPATGLWKIQPKRVVKPRKQTNKQTDVTHNKEILEGQDMVKQFRGNLFKDAMSTVSIYGRMSCTIGTWVNEAAVIF
jgi:hypothetical protein